MTWRGVEAQHAISTMRLVDSADEQELLEGILEKSKPPLPADAEGRHFLISTPFRYVSNWPSRFRGPSEPGIWYGAERVDTVCAEVGYWRWRFLCDSEGLREHSLVLQFTLFQAKVSGMQIDLTMSPWRRADRQLMHKSDYATCQWLARESRARGIAWIQYASVRDGKHGKCAAVLDVNALSLPRRLVLQTWEAKIQMNSVFFHHLGESLQFDATLW